MTATRETIVDSQTGAVTALDQRTPAECAAHCIAQAKAVCRMQIEQGAPDYRQRNAALGLLSEAERLAVVQLISDARALCAEREAAILAALEGWNGTEATRAAVCDAMEEACA